jgi:hypothetical protein
MIMTHRSVPFKRQGNLSYIGENMIPVTSDMIPTHHAKAVVRKISKFKFKSRILFQFDIENSNLEHAKL